MKRERDVNDDTPSEAPAAKYVRATSNPDTDALWRDLLLGDYRVHQLANLTVLEMAVYLRTHPDITHLSEIAYHIAFLRDMQAPMGGGLYGFAQTILDEYYGLLSYRECYALANTTLALGATQARPARFRSRV